MNRPVIKKIFSLLLLAYATGGTAQRMSFPLAAYDTVAFPPPVFKATVFDSSRLSGYYCLTAKKEDLVFVVILDKYGGVVCFKPCAHNVSALVETDGRILLEYKHTFFFVDSAFRVIDSVSCKNKYQTDNHDILTLPDKHIILLGEESLFVDLKKHPEWKRRNKSDSIAVKASIIQELDSARNVIFEWHAKDHFDFDDVDTFFFNSGGPFEWTHSNALELDTDGNILLSSRNFCEITKINRTNGNVMWRWGGHRNEFKFVNCPFPFYGQHNIRRLANGHFTLFDNGDYVEPHGARALEFDLDETNKVATLVWSYTYDEDMTSNGQGNVQRLENGNTLVNFGRNSCDDVTFVIVDSTGSKIFQIDENSAYKAVNLSTMPWHLHRPQINVRDSAGVTYLAAEAGYYSYHWNNGSTGRVIPVNNAGQYYVFTSYGEGVYVSSLKALVTKKTPLKLKHGQKGTFSVKMMEE